MSNMRLQWGAVLAGLIYKQTRAAKTKLIDNRTRPQVEELEDRSVPAMLDLTTVGAAGTINNAIFEQANPQPTGVGVIHDFLRIQSHQGTVEQGYNTDARPLQFDEKTDPNFTRAIHLSELPTVTIDGVVYRVILLGVNQKQSDPLISLDELRLYVSDSPNLTGYDPATQELAGLTAVYDLNAGGGGGNWVKLNSSLSHGNGSGDMFLFVPDSVFASASTDPYVYLYSEFGVHNATNGGFEQWAPATGLVPPPATITGFVFVDSNNTGVLTSGDSPVAGVVITLTGTNNLGQTVNMTATTASDGSYLFVGLFPGTYTLTKTPPAGYIDGLNSVGTVNGVNDGTSLNRDVLTSIFLGYGQAGINYNFGELPPPNSGS